MIRISKRRKPGEIWRGLKKENGSMVIEASVVFPIILYCSLAMIFMGMFVFLKVMATHAAALAADRAAVVWTNSSKDPKTGLFPDNTYDPLYWRVYQDQLLDRVLDIGTQQDNFQVPIPSTEWNSLATKKLHSAVGFVPLFYTGNMKFNNSLMERTVRASLASPMLDYSVGRMLKQEINIDGEAVSAVVEPAEFIRTVEFVRFMTVKLKSLAPLGADPRQAGQLIMRVESSPP
ncbi:hypothetical protein [Paenibacillus taiwanensis]|uniref:hypothetical protein n=1 Tax=Paenibacillus taiwanensis TaxID=401638 RepID=UPI0003F59FE7|nr:hypothetical protein [Paenibacillus taiwanensis]